MNSRRGFFRSLAKTAAIIALAPQLAFRVRPEVVDVAAIDRELQRAWVNMFFFGERLPDDWHEKYAYQAGLKSRFINGMWAHVPKREVKPLP